jgi:hypothetical protein
MTRLTACPSPKGTNIERLFIPLPANTLAHDAAIDPDRARNAVDRRRGRARDEGEPDDDLIDAVSELQEHLNNSIGDPGALTQAHALVERLLGAAGAGQTEDEAGNNPDRQDQFTSGTRDARRGMDRRPSAADFAGGGLGLDRRWPSRGGDARAEARAEAQFERMFGPPPRQL